jgi:hypothetical protein
MNPTQMLATSLLLGLFVLLAGGYGVLYCLAQLNASERLRKAAFVSYALQGLCVALLALTLIDFWWKVLVLAGFVAYLPIPPLTWRFLESLHLTDERHT